MGWSLALLLLFACPPKRGDNSALVYQLDSEVIALKQKIAWLEESQASCGSGSGPAPIYAELVQIMPASEAKVSREGAVTIVEIPVSALFASGSFRIRSESVMVLDLLATAINLHPTSPIEVVGYTDDSPLRGSLQRYYFSNWELSAMRAGAVARELMDSYQVAPERITIAGRGPMTPIADNDTPEGRDTNRRIQVRILPPAALGEDPTSLTWQ
jgi:flagellar motor protein MotB